MASLYSSNLALYFSVWERWEAVRGWGRHLDFKENYTVSQAVPKTTDVKVGVSFKTLALKPYHFAQ